MGNEAPVLIAGGGLTGLAMASFLAQQGIRSITVERLKESSPLPRAAFFHMRTIEMFRELGIEARVRQESAKEFIPDGALIAMDCVSGRKLADIISNLNEGVDAVSPCHRWFLNQPSLEPILREQARAAGAEILQGTEVTGLRQDSSGVTLTVRDVDGGNQQRTRGPVSHRRRRRPLENPRAAGHRLRRPRRVLEVTDYLLHRRPVAVDPRQCLEHHLREQPGAGRILPHEPLQPRRLPRASTRSAIRSAIPRRR